jgi:hypothetical protein
MPVYIRYDLPEGDLRVIAETETAFIIAVNVPKAVITRNRQLLEMLLEAIAGEASDG